MFLCPLVDGNSLPPQVLDNKILEKPGSDARAREMLTRCAHPFTGNTEV